MQHRDRIDVLAPVRLCVTYSHDHAASYELRATGGYGATPTLSGANAKADDMVDVELPFLTLNDGVWLMARQEWYVAKGCIDIQYRNLCPSRRARNLQPRALKSAPCAMPTSSCTAPLVCPAESSRYSATGDLCSRNSNAQGAISRELGRATMDVSRCVMSAAARTSESSTY